MLYGLTSDIGRSGTPPLEIGVLVLLGIVLVIALGFEFVNGFHDTTNAVATVIYTQSVPARVWLGCWNLLGVIPRAVLLRSVSSRYCRSS